MEIISKNLKQVEIDAPFRLDLDDSFVAKFNSVFKFKGKEINVVGNANEPWFRAKDILEILGYSENKNTQNNILKKIHPDFKKYLHEVGNAIADGSLSYNEGKEVYLSEAGLFYVIMKSKLDAAREFQMYSYKELFPGIRKIIQKRYEDSLKEKQDQMNIIIKQNELTRQQNNELIKQNQMALQKLQEMGITLDETKTTLEETREQNEEILEELENTNNKLDRALPDRNVDPNDDKLKHHFILFKRKDDESQYVFVRGQDKYIKCKKSEFEKEFDITLDKTKTPNPIDMVNRLKQRVQEINEIAYSAHLEELKQSEEYQDALATGKRSMIYNCKKKYSRLTYRSNKIKLLNFSEEELLKMVRRLDAEKYDV